MIHDSILLFLFNTGAYYTFPRLGLNVKIVAVSDFKKGSIYAPDGLDIPVRKEELIPKGC
jgi:hypothetical protein